MNRRTVLKGLAVAVLAPIVGVGTAEAHHKPGHSHPWKRFTPKPSPRPTTSPSASPSPSPSVTPSPSRTPSPSPSPSRVDMGYPARYGVI